MKTNGDADKSLRSFVWAGVGAAALTAFGRSSLVSADDAVNTQANLDLASVVAGQLAFPGSRAEFKMAFDEIIVHENAHVKFLVNALGAAARPKPTFKGLKQANLKSFILQSVAFENTGAGAYCFAAQYILSHNYRFSAAQIALVEGRHAGFLNVATGQPITVDNADFETPLSPQTVAARVAPFIQSLNGGPPLTYGTVLTAANDIEILNFALALEYLEAEYYNDNVPTFY